MLAGWRSDEKTRIRVGVYWSWGAEDVGRKNQCTSVVAFGSFRVVSDCQLTDVSFQPLQVDFFTTDFDHANMLPIESTISPPNLGGHQAYRSVVELLCSLTDEADAL